MSSLSAVLFATSVASFGEEERLIATAFLKEGHHPCWEIHISDKVFRFIPDPQHLLEDGLWQLSDYCQIPYQEYAADVNYNEPLAVAEEFGEEVCTARRTSLAAELRSMPVNFRLLLWPGSDEKTMRQTLSNLSEEGLSIDILSWTKNQKS